MSSATAADRPRRRRASAPPTSVGQPSRRQAGARLLQRQVLAVEHGAGRQRAPRDDAAREQARAAAPVSRAERVLVDRVRAHALDEADAVDQLPQLAGRHRRDDVGTEHLAADSVTCTSSTSSPSAARGEAGIDRAGVIRQADRAAVALAIDRQQVEADLLGRARDRPSCTAARRPACPRALTRATAASSSASGLMPVDSSTGAPVASTRRAAARCATSPDAIFHSGMPTRSQQVDRLERERRAR